MGGQNYAKYNKLNNNPEKFRGARLLPGGASPPLAPLYLRAWLYLLPDDDLRFLLCYFQVEGFMYVVYCIVVGDQMFLEMQDFYFV